MNVYFSKANIFEHFWAALLGFTGDEWTYKIQMPFQLTVEHCSTPGGLFMEIEATNEVTVATSWQNLPVSLN